MTIHQEPTYMKPGDFVVWPGTEYHGYWNGQVIIPLCPWAVPGIGEAIDKGLDSIADDPTPMAVNRTVMAILNEAGYDSIDRESSFSVACARFGMEYEDIYQAWLHDDQNLTHG